MVQRGHDVTQQICTPVGVTVLAVNQNPPEQKEIPFRNDKRFQFAQFSFTSLIMPLGIRHLASRAPRQTGRAKIATYMSHGREPIR